MTELRHIRKTLKKSKNIHYPFKGEIRGEKIGLFYWLPWNMQQKLDFRLKSKWISSSILEIFIFGLQWWCYTGSSNCFKYFQQTYSMKNWTIIPKNVFACILEASLFFWSTPNCCNGLSRFPNYTTKGLLISGPRSGWICCSKVDPNMTSF